ncbi:MAG: MBOAT family protein [Eubacterium sp.]|nr:MBOAT family protein [Eubacterium sp.]
MKLVFNSVEFLFYFLPLFFLIYYLSPKKIKNMILLAGSLIFYAHGEPVYVILLILSVYFNYYVGLCLGNNKGYDTFEYEEFKYDEIEYDEIEYVDLEYDESELERSKHRKAKKKEKRKQGRKCWLLVTAVIANVGVLALFKYHIGNLSLPLGMSFYTFQVLAYLIDVYKGTVQREGSLLNFANYITMFPKLISGPIADYGRMKEQLVSPKISAKRLQDGMKCFTVGLGLKVLLADSVGILWHEVQVIGFESISTPLAWLGAIAYSMKIYFDFYGYSLMAIGLGRMLGFELPKNFDNPYMAKSVREFYRRWHITLGKWFCQYVYIPLGGSRRGEIKTIFNLLVVWLLTAIWHGNTLNFLIWGGLLVCCIVMERFLGKTGLGRYFHVLPHLYLWVVIPVSWMCFAITDVEQLGVYLGRMTGLVPAVTVLASDWQNALQSYGGLLLAAVLLCTPIPGKIYNKLKKNFFGSIILAVLFWVCVHRILLEGNNPFMYFRF